MMMSDSEEDSEELQTKAELAIDNCYRQSLKGNTSKCMKGS